MTPVEKITAAIARLEKLKAEVDPGPLVRWRDQEHIPGWDGFIVIGDSAEEGEDCNPVARVYTEDLAEMLITLHRTIDAQLTILRGALGGARDLDMGHTPDEPASTVDALNLADAILGES